MDKAPGARGDGPVEPEFALYPTEGGGRGRDSNVGLRIEVENQCEQQSGAGIDGTYDERPTTLII